MSTVHTRGFAISWVLMRTTKNFIMCLAGWRGVDVFSEGIVTNYRDNPDMDATIVLEYLFKNDSKTEEEEDEEEEDKDV